MLRTRLPCLKHTLDQQNALATTVIVVPTTDRCRDIVCYPRSDDFIKLVERILCGLVGSQEYPGQLCVREDCVDSKDAETSRPDRARLRNCSTTIQMRPDWAKPFQSLLCRLIAR